MNICAILGCNNSSKSCGKGIMISNGISYHKFPINPDIRAEWVKATGRKDWLPNENSVVCSVHFSKHQLSFSKNDECVLLAADAVPRVPVICKERNKIPYYDAIPDCPSCITNSFLYEQKIKKQDMLIAKQRAKIKMLQFRNRRSMKKIETIEKLLEPIQEKLCNLKNVNLQVQDLLLKQITKKDSKGNMRTEL